jgi:hypothetical protein
MGVDTLTVTLDSEEATVDIKQPLDIGASSRFSSASWLRSLSPVAFLAWCKVLHFVVALLGTLGCCVCCTSFPGVAATTNVALSGVGSLVHAFLQKLLY